LFILAFKQFLTSKDSSSCICYWNQGYQR